MAELSAYQTALAFKRARPAHIKAAEDQDRVTAYWTYGEIYKNVTQVFKEVIRTPDGEEAYVRYIPSARTIIEACNRYLAVDLAWVQAPPSAVSTATPEQFAETMGVIQTFFDREEFAAKFLSLKRTMLKKGDGLFHISVDESKPQGQRLSLQEVDPGTFFKIPDPLNSARLKGCYLVEIVLDDEGEEIAQRLEYQRILTEEDAAASGAPVGTVWTRLQFFEPDGWDDRAHVGFSVEDLAPVAAPSRFGSESAQALIAGRAFPAAITAIPVYHFRNNRDGDAPFGTSEIQGIETLIAGINQGASDQDLSVALNGLGVYATDSGPPLTRSGAEGDWVIAPASVMECQDGKKFWRVEGITTVQPSLDHINMLQSQARQTSATPDVAIGIAQSAEVESGIALAIKMGPIIAKNAEKELEIGGKLNQMLYDLVNGWLPTYEGYSPNGSVVQASFADPLPINRKEFIEEITALLTAKVISTEFARERLKALGYNFPAGMLDQIAAEDAKLLDSTSVRLDQAAGAAPEGGPAAGGV